MLPLISARYLRKGALVCDVSRPFNLTPDLGDDRPDLRLVSGGLLHAPETSLLGHLEEHDQPNVLVACAAETIILALSRYQAKQLCGRLNVTTIQELGQLAEKLGFSVATQSRFS
jgi:fatty aldehyde-generating acyl-ACP reductase